MDTIFRKPFEVPNPDHLIIRGLEMVLVENQNLDIPTVILSPGFTATMKETEPYALALAKKGNRVFQFDFCGGSWNSSSEGSFSDYMSVETEKGDLLSVLDYVMKQPHIKSVFLLGCSQGGFVSVLAAADNHTDVAGLILLYPALCIPDDARRGQMQTMHFDPKHVPEHVGSAPKRVSRRYVTDAQVINLDEMLKRIHCPVLILHGTADQIVPVHYAVDAANLLSKTDHNVFLHLYEGADHGFHNVDILDDVTNRIEKFIDAYK